MQYSSSKFRVRASRLMHGAAVFAFVAAAGHTAYAAPFLSFRTNLPAAVDQNGVDLATGQFVPPAGTASVGSGESGMSDSIGGMDFPNGSQFIGAIHSNHESPDVWALDAVKNYGADKIHFGNRRPRTGERFTVNWGIPNPYSASVWTTSDGTEIEFSSEYASDLDLPANMAVVSRVTKPDGEVLEFWYNRELVPSGDPDGGLTGHPPEYLVKGSLASVQSSLGWNMGGSSSFGYSSYSFGNASFPWSSTFPGVAGSSGGAGVWPMTSSVDGQMVTYKQRVANQMGSDDGHKSFYVTQYVEHRRRYIQDRWDLGEETWANRRVPTNASWEYVNDLDGDSDTSILHWTYVILEKTEYSTQSGAAMTVLYYTPPDDYNSPIAGASGCAAFGAFQQMTCVKSVTRGGKIWKYTWTGFNDPTYGYIPEVDIEDPSGKHKKFRTTRHDFAGTLVTWMKDEENRITTFEYGEYGQLTKLTHPDSNYEQYIYDDRGNLKESRFYPKGGGTPQIETASFEVSTQDGTCTNLKTCNKPQWTRDAAGNLPANINNPDLQTDYTYAPAHGGVLTVTGPAVFDPVSGQNVRPQTRYEYAQKTPQILSYPNQVLTDSTPVWRLVKESTCRTATSANPASCVGTANEQIKTYEYSHRNLLLTSTTIKAGNADTGQPYSSTNVWQTTTYEYDVVGNTVSVDGPLPGTVDKTYTTFDTRRRPVFQIGADPDGSGPLTRAVVKHTYNPDGQETLTESGTGNTIVFTNSVPTSVSDFVVTSSKRNTYDTSTGLLTKSEVVIP